MKNLIKCLLMIFILTANAKAFKIEIQDLNGQYNSPDGKGVARKFILEGFDFLLFDADSVPITLTCKKNDHGIDITYADQSYFWQDPPKIILEAETVKLKKIEIKTYRQVLKSSVSSLQLDSKKDFFKLDNFSLFCQNPGRTSPEPSDFAINACTTQAKINIETLRYEDKTKKNALTRLLRKIIPENDNEEASKINVQSLSLTVNQHQFNLKSQVSYKIKTGISAKGRSWYDMKTKVLKVRLDQVKVSFFNITGKVFSELEKNQNENLKVNRPYIYIKR